MSRHPFSSVEEAIDDIRAGRMVVVCDDEDRENEGDIVIAAQFATPEAINFMAKEARGLICLALTGKRCDELELDLMAAKNESPFETAFTVSVEAREGVTTGISAHDRAHTVQVAIDPGSKPSDLVQPGHVFPLRARPGGVLERTGQTEAAVDLARLAGLIPAGVICEVMNEDGTMARVKDLVPYCARHGMKLITVADLIASGVANWAAMTMSPSFSRSSSSQTTTIRPARMSSIASSTGAKIPDRSDRRSSRSPASVLMSGIPPASPRTWPARRPPG